MVTTENNNFVRPLSINDTAIIAMARKRYFFRYGLISKGSFLSPFTRPLILVDNSTLTFIVYAIVVISKAMYGTIIIREYPTPLAE